MLRVDLEKRLGDFRLSLEFQSVESGITALFGPSGSGKTTVLNLIAGLVRPDRGRISVNGRVLFDAEKKIDLKPEERRIGYVFQEGRLFPHLSVKGNLLYGLRILPEGERRLRPREVIDLMGIGRLLDRRPYSPLRRGEAAGGHRPGSPHQSPAAPHGRTLGLAGPGTQGRGPPLSRGTEVGTAFAHFVRQSRSGRSKTPGRPGAFRGPRPSREGRARRRRFSFTQRSALLSNVRLSGAHTSGLTPA